MSFECVIEFDNNPSKVVYTGQLLRGKVQLNLANEKSVRCVYIKIKGEATVRLSTGSGRRRRTHLGKEEYLNDQTYFVGSENANRKFSIKLINYDFFKKKKIKIKLFLYCR